MTNTRSEGPVRILLVEDNPGDVRLVKESFREASVEISFRTVHDGDVALDILRDRTGDEEEAFDLILLDLNLPRTSGFEVLETINHDEAFVAPPVIVLTSSEDVEDVARSYELCANAYLTKPTDPAEFTELGQAVESFWFDEAAFPPSPA